MKSIAFANLKGGVGKTSISGNLGFLSSKQKKTLIVDADPQSSLTSWLVTDQPKWELSDVLQGKVSLSKALMEIKNNLFILPSFAIGGTLKNYSETALEKESFVFQDLAEEARALDFEMLIYDTHPGNTRLERCILVSCQEAIVPVTPEYLSLDGIEIFKEFLREIAQGFKVRVRHEKLILNLVNKSFRRHSMYKEKIQNLGYELFEIGQDSRIAESQIMHQSLIDYAPESRVIPELKRLSNAIMGVA